MERPNTVEVTEKKVVIPTYGIGKPEKNPMFLENRVYQGSSGVVYPHPVIEKILDEKTDKEYRALFIENKYLKIMILPELGGRIQMAYDKIRERHFIYYNRVIKPALVGLTGPWISGGIEFNWPQHHRPSTFDPIDFTIEEHDDGSKTVWVSEVERMFRTKGMAGFRLYPDKAYLEINARLYNRTPFAQTFLWWANPAVKVNDHYQSVFPPDINAVFDHGKRDVSEFPIAKGTYYKVDYSPGTDISRYKNIPVPTSYMATKSKYDFMGGYEHDTKAGILHVANHHISPGKKQWTWGNSDFGYAWDRNLTDEDGPYIELMTGVFTDNQPDFSWMQPYEERTFSQYFMPYCELGAVKNATKDAMISVTFEEKAIGIKFYVTSEQRQAVATLTVNKKVVWSEVISLSPENAVTKIIKRDIPFNPEECLITLYDAKRKTLVSYQPDPPSEKEVPKPVEAAKEPNEITSVEQLFLTGLHLEQYRHATYRATDYYEEALRREPTDVRSNNAMGLWFLKRGKFKQSVPFFSKAIETLTSRNPNPFDGEPFFNLGFACFMSDDFENAYENFYKAAWNAGCQDAAYLQLARIAVRKGDFEQALEHIDKSLIKNYTSHTARHLKISILRKSGDATAAFRLIAETLAIDKLNFGCLFEEYLLLKNTDTNEAEETKSNLVKRIRGNAHTYIEYALDYAHAGLYEEATELLLQACPSGENVYPLVHYYLGYFAFKREDFTSAVNFFHQAQKDFPDYCFPNRIEDVNVLERAMMLNPSDARAPYYLGNFWYANRQYEDSIVCWEKARALDDSFPTVHRNLALAYHNKQLKFSKALKSLEKAFALDTSDARVLMELDQLHKKLNKPHTQRLELLEKYPDQTLARDDLYLEKITLYNHLGLYRRAKELLRTRKFHPWEGGEGKVVGQHLVANIALAKVALEEQRFEDALSLLNEAENYPENLGEGKLYGTQENDIHYLKGCACEGLGDPEKAKAFFTSATKGLSAPVQAVYYNDQQPDKIFYQGLAWRKLGHPEKAEAIFNRLIAFGNEHVNDKIKIDYFAVSLPDLLVFDQDLDQRNKNHCNYLIGLGYLGLNNDHIEKAIIHFNLVVQHDVNYPGAAIHLKMALGMRS